MKLTLFLAPMKAGKSLALMRELIRYLDKPGYYNKRPFVAFQPLANVRDKDISSRVGISLKAEKVDSLARVLERDLVDITVIGIDEIHMFPKSDAKVIDELLRRNIDVVVAGLDNDYQGETFPIVAELYKLGPVTPPMYRGKCEDCDREAIYTQILEKGVPVLENLPPVVPEDGTYEYRARCRHCFVRPKTAEKTPDE